MLQKIADSEARRYMLATVDNAEQGICRGDLIIVEPGRPARFIRHLEDLTHADAMTMVTRGDLQLVSDETLDQQPPKAASPADCIIFRVSTTMTAIGLRAQSGNYFVWRKRDNTALVISSDCNHVLRKTANVRRQDAESMIVALHRSGAIEPLRQADAIMFEALM